VPLPARLKRGSKKKRRKRVSAVMHELEHGKVNAPSRKAAKRNGTSRKQNIAIALKNAGLSRKSKRAKKRKSKRKARR
jgi:hypothetical protein